MTCKEKLKQVRPEMTTYEIETVVNEYCPDMYGLLGVPPGGCIGYGCTKCWNREIPESKEDKETLCDTCIHRQVCSIKERYLAAVSAADNMTVNFDDGSVNYLRNMTWIRPVRLECIYYSAPALEVR